MTARNVLIIMSDEHSPRYMGCSGHPLVSTPHLDALAARGLRFTDAYTPSPICVPARAAFATGRRVHQTRHWDNATPYFGAPSGWGHVLQQAGVRVESIGKLHYRSASDAAGFDVEHLPMHVAGGHGMVWASIRDPYLVRREGKRMLGESIGAGETSYTRYDASVTERAIEWLTDAGRAEGFVLYVGLVAPHFPLSAPQAFFDRYPLDRLPEPKLHPATGYQRHPWVEDYARFEDNEARFADPQERLRAFAAYFGLCSWLDHNVGRILAALDRAGLTDSTTVIYTSDHGDNVGARGLWGKSTLYQESVTVPMLLAGPGIRPGVCRTPVDLLDLHPTILQCAGLGTADQAHATHATHSAHSAHSAGTNESVDMAGATDRGPGRSLIDIGAAPTDADRPIFSEYHAAGSNTGGFMLRKGRWKFHYYVRHRPELFDLARDPEELHDLARDPAHAATLAHMEAALRGICDPEGVDAQARSDQRAMIERYGGVEAASTLGATGATPAPTPAPTHTHTHTPEPATALTPAPDSGIRARSGA